MKIRAIITGTTGMIGEGVLHECLKHKDVEAVLVINRKPCGVQHPKLKEIIHQNFFDFSAIEAQLKNYNACYFCLGVSSVGMSQKDYTHFTYDLTLHVAQTLLRQNSDMTFIYISGSGTDSSEKGSLMWARVKGKTENDLIKLGFKQAFAFRPAAIEPGAGMKNTVPAYKYVSWLFPLAKLVAPNYVSTLSTIGLAMINATLNGYEKKVVEVKDIKAMGGMRE